MALLRAQLLDLPDGDLVQDLPDRQRRRLYARQPGAGRVVIRPRRRESPGGAVYAFFERTSTVRSESPLITAKMSFTTSLSVTSIRSAGLHFSFGGTSMPMPVQ